MALRVLLADESPTIKKVFQLSLQDYGVEVRAINVGTDVIEATKSFKPDIIFADVLLQQLSGYQVSSQLKAEEEHSHIPIVLMWSGFMDIDEDKFQASQADAKLEKPFEVDKLRDIIKELVPKLQSQSISEFLDFPDVPTPEKEDKVEETAPEPPAQNPPEPTQPQQAEAATPKPSSQTEIINEELQTANDAEANSTWNMEEFESVNITEQMQSRESDEEKFKNQDLINDEEEDSDWIQGNIETFKLDIDVDNNVNVEEEEVPLDNVVSPSAVEAATRETSLIPPLPKNNLAKEDEDDLEVEKVEEEEDYSNINLADIPQLNEDRLMGIIEAQSKEVIEKVVWKVVPELATQIIERELKRLLEEQNLNEKSL